MSPDRSIRGIGMTSARTRDRLVSRLREQGIDQPEILARIRDVPRHLFVDEALETRAYEDSALPIGQGQTISQPYIVALMTQALLEEGDSLRRPAKVLEVGTGCGYQTAVLAPLVERIFTIERLNGLLQSARQRLSALGLSNIRYRHGDGLQGWPGQAPFDGILVAAAPPAVPGIFLEQLAPGGRLVIPVGPAGDQDLIRITMESSGPVQEQLCRVSFVPMLGGRD